MVIVNTVFEERVEQLFLSMRRLHEALDRAGIPYEIVGGLAVFLHVESVDPALSRLTRDIDALVQRADLPRIQQAVAPFGLTYRHAAGPEMGDMLVETADPKAKTAIHLILAGEKVRPDYPEPAPPLGTGTLVHGARVISLDELLRMKLTSFRLKDQVHIQDLDAAGLITPSMEQALPAALRERLAQVRAAESSPSAHRQPPRPPHLAPTVREGMRSPTPTRRFAKPVGPATTAFSSDRQGGDAITVPADPARTSIQHRLAQEPKLSGATGKSDATQLVETSKDASGVYRAAGSRVTLDRRGARVSTRGHRRVPAPAGDLIPKDALSTSGLERRHLDSGVLIVGGDSGVADLDCTNVSPIESATQYLFATLEGLQISLPASCCKTRRLRKRSLRAERNSDNFGAAGWYAIGRRTGLRYTVPLIVI